MVTENRQDSTNALLAVGAIEQVVDAPVPLPGVVQVATGRAVPGG